MYTKTATTNTITQPLSHSNPGTHTTRLHTTQRHPCQNTHTYTITAIDIDTETDAQLYTDICNTHTHCFSPLQKQRHTIINYRQIHTDIDAPSYTKVHEYRHTKLQSAHGHSASMDTHARPGTPSSTAKPVTHT